MSSVVTSENCSRVFPVVGPELHVQRHDDRAASQPMADQPPGIGLLALSQRRFNPLQRWSGIGLDPAGHAGRLFLFHRLAIEAERSGRFQRADFFWRQTNRQLRHATQDPAFWPAVLESVDVPANTPLRELSERLSRIVIGEVVIDTHQAWMHCYLAKTPEPDANSRAFVHLHYLRDYADLIELEPTAKQALIGPTTLLEVTARERSREWQRAADLASDLLRRFPEETAYQNRLAATYVAQARGTLNNGDGLSRNLKDATRLARFIYSLKKLRLDYPHNWFIFERIAELYHLRTEKLAAAGQLAEALADVQAALTHQPDFPQAEETRARLEGEMQQIRIQMAAPEAERPALSKRQLKAMARQASKGFRLSEGYKRSEEARAAEEDLTVARGRRIWESAGLEPLARIDHRPLALIDALVTICYSPPTEPSGIPAAWRHVSSDNPYLSSLESERVYAYLNQRLFNDSADDADPGKCESSVDVESDPVPFRPAAPRRGSEPFLYWLFSSEGKLLKLQCVIALVLVFAGVRLAVLEFSHRRVRDVAYQQIHEARLKQDYAGMLDAAERFLDHPIIGRDSRKTEVEGLYSEALLRWFVQEQPPGEESVRLERYRRFLNSSAN